MVRMTSGANADATGDGRVGLLERLERGPVVCAEGYVFELERRGYLQAGSYVPEVVLEHPEVVRQLHLDFVRAGSDVVETLTYYGHREKMRVIGKEDLLEPLNRQALAIAKEVALAEGALFAGDICNTNQFIQDDEKSAAAARAMFEEQVGWAVEAAVDYVIAETFFFAEEALIALEVVKSASLPAVVTLAIHSEGMTFDGLTPAEACRRLEAAGADVVGLNCLRGPQTTLPLLREIRKAVSCHVAALPVPYRTTEEEPTFFALSDPRYDRPDGTRAFPDALDGLACTRYEIADFGREAHELGASYLGVCCGAGPHHIRSLAEALGRTPPASRYSADMSKHAFLGTDPRVTPEYQEYGPKL
jgi:betaine-homocysteine S-methyltransferase